MKQNVQVLRSRTKLGRFRSHHIHVMVGYWSARLPKIPRPTARTKAWNRWQLIYTVGGQGLLKYPAGELMLLPQTAILLSPHMEYAFQTDPDLQRWDQYSAVFLPRSHWYGWLHWPEIVPGVMACNTEKPLDQQQIRAALDKAITTADTPRPFWEDFAMAALEKVLLLFYDLVERLSPPPSQKSQIADQQLQAAVEFLENNQANTIDYPQVAQAAGVSYSYLGTLFQKYLRMTPQQYLIMLRINTAQRMLRTTNKQTAEIARAIGYKNPAAFCYRFRKITGQTPSEYRKALK